MAGKIEDLKARVAKEKAAAAERKTREEAEKHEAERGAKENERQTAEVRLGEVASSLEEDKASLAETQELLSDTEGVEPETIELINTQIRELGDKISAAEAEKTALEARIAALDAELGSREPVRVEEVTPAEIVVEAPAVVAETVEAIEEKIELRAELSSEDQEKLKQQSDARKRGVALVMKTDSEYRHDRRTTPWEARNQILVDLKQREQFLDHVMLRTAATRPQDFERTMIAMAGTSDAEILEGVRRKLTQEQNKELDEFLEYSANKFLRESDIATLESRLKWFSGIIPDEPSFEAQYDRVVNGTRNALDFKAKKMGLSGWKELLEARIRELKTQT